MRKKVMRILSLCMVASMTLTPIQSVYAAEMTSVIKIDEVESNEPTTDIDWVEIYNAGSSDVDISGWYLYDNDPVGHAADITPVTEGIVLASNDKKDNDKETTESPKTGDTVNV